MPGDLSYSDTGQLTARSERGARKQDLAHRHDARRWSQTSGSLLGRGQANGIGAGAEQLAIAAPQDHSLSAVHHGQREKSFGRKWLDVATDGGKSGAECGSQPQQTLPAGLFANQWRTRPQGWQAKPFAASLATNPGGSVGDGRDRPAVYRGFQPCKDLGLDQSSRILVLVTECALGGLT